MEDWYTLYKMVKAQQREHELWAMNLELVKSQKSAQANRMLPDYRSAMNQLGRVLETWGRHLQKRFQTC